jgi:transcriptional regulator
MAGTNEPMDVIKVKQLLTSPFAVSTEEGEKLFKLINERLSNKKKVTIDFSKIELIVSTFLNASIGQLYGLFSTEFIQKNLSVINISNEDLVILKKVTDRAKEYFKDKKGLDKVFNKHFPDASE